MTDQQKPVAMIELVDSGIRFVGDNEAAGSGEAPGYALLTAEGVISGQAALRRAWLEPQRSFNQFWHQLNLAPLPVSSRHARHHADLAYAQLQAIHREAGEPQQFLFAVPGSFSRDQLAILLGLVNALPFTAVGLVDSAVAALSNSQVTGSALHIEIQLHQCLLTLVELDDQVRRARVEPVAETGIRHFYNSWSQHIADLFIREYRYDPLHTAEGEQQLQDNLPSWLAQLANTPETVIELATARGNFRLKLNRKALLATTERHIARLTEARASMGEVEHVVASHRFAGLPGMAGVLGAQVLAADACLQGCKTKLAEICQSGEAIQHITRLSLPPAARAVAAGAFATPDHSVETSPPRSTDAGRATHLLQGHRSWPIGNGLGISLEDGTPKIGFDRNAPARLQYSGNQLQLHSRDPRIRAAQGDNLTPGDRIACGNLELLLVEEQKNG